MEWDPSHSVIVRPSWVMEGGSGLSHFSEHLYRIDLSQIRILDGNWHFRWGWFFQLGLDNSLYKKIEYKSQAKKIFDYNFYNFSLLVPYPNNFLVVCICILIFHGIYSPLPTNIFLWETFFFRVLQGLGRFQISWRASVLGEPNFLFGRGELDHFFSIKPSMTNDGEIICFICAC